MQKAIGAGAAAVLILGCWIFDKCKSDDPVLIDTLEMETSEPAATDPVKEVSQKIWVEVRGAVNNPGEYPLDPGARVTDAIAAAGGMLIKNGFVYYLHNNKEFVGYNWTGREKPITLTSEVHDSGGIIVKTEANETPTSKSKKVQHSRSKEAPHDLTPEELCIVALKMIRTAIKMEHIHDTFTEDQIREYFPASIPRTFRQPKERKEK